MSDAAPTDLWRCFCGRLYAAIPKAGCLCGRKTKAGFRRVLGRDRVYDLATCLSEQDKRLLRALHISTE